VTGRQPKGALFGTHGFHSRYLSNEFAGIKETFLLLFLDEMFNRAWCFSITSPRSTTIFLGRKLGGFAGEMRMFESLAGQAEK